LDFSPFFCTILLIDNNFIQFMADGRKNNGGHRNGGRKSKAEEQKLVEKLKPIEPKALAVLKENVEAGEKWAVELFFKYCYGMPKQQTDVTTKGEKVTNFINLGGDPQ
jgi:hypothetical protein